MSVFYLTKTTLAINQNPNEIHELEVLISQKLQVFYMEKLEGERNK